MLVIARALGAPEMMRHTFQRQRLDRRPWQGLVGGGVRPGFQMGEIRPARPPAILAYAFAREML